MVLFTAPALPADVVTMPTITPATTATVRTSTSAPNGWTEYRVKGGDTLIGLAAIFRTTPGELATQNGLPNPRALRAGAVILVPRGDAAAPATSPAADSASAQPAPQTAPQPASAAGGTAYLVKRGDTLWAIAAAHGTTVPAILKANGLTAGAHIHPGQTLSIGGAPTSAAAAAAAKPAPTAPAPAVSESQDTIFPGVDGTPAMSRSVAQNRALLATATVPSRTATRDLIIATAAQHGVDPKLALAISMQESGWNQRNVSGVNAIGAMQVIPAGGQWASSLLGRELNLLDTRDNVTAGVVMIRALGRMTSSEDELIAAYYQGLHSVRTKGWYDDTHFYVRSIHALKGRV